MTNPALPYLEDLGMKKCAKKPHMTKEEIIQKGIQQGTEELAEKFNPYHGAGGRFSGGGGGGLVARRGAPSIGGTVAGKNVSRATAKQALGSGMNITQGGLVFKGSAAAARRGERGHMLGRTDTIKASGSLKKAGIGHSISQHTVNEFTVKVSLTD